MAPTRLALVLCLVATAAAGPARADERRANPLRRIADTLAETRIAFSCGVIVGVPGLDGKLECGVVKAARGDAQGGGPFVAVGGHLGVGAVNRYYSPNPAMRGTERALCLGATVGRRNPVHGDRVSVGVQVVTVSASRKGGLGGEFSAIPLPSLCLPLFRGSAALYLANPGLSRLSGAVVDRIDRGHRWLERRTGRARRWLRRQGARVRQRLRPAARAERDSPSR